MNRFTAAFLSAMLALVGLGGWASPKAFLPVETFDFGEIPEGVLVCREFTLLNLGDEELVLGTVAPSCACTSAPLPRDRLAPGESLSIKVCFDSSGYGGKRVFESVSIRTNDPEQPWVRLGLSGYVRPALPHEALAKDLFSALYLLLDVRDPEAYARGHLLGAVNLPFPKLSESLESLPRGLPILVYGEEAEEATKILRNQGLLARVLGADPERWASLFRSLSVGETPPPPKIFGDVPAFPAENLAKRYLLVLDLRPAEIFREGTLPGAIQVNPEDLPAWAERLPKAGDLPEGVSFQVWIVDEDGKGADEAARFLREEGIPAVALVGGLANWRARYGQTWLIPPFWTKTSAVP
jgi:rhodanese-related sulfurtransferase